jgi:hypothetical protein
MGMRNYMTPILLLLVFIALVGDIFVRARPVHAQTLTDEVRGATMYVDQVAAQTSVHQRVRVGGGDFVAFSCSGQFCYILSR